MLATTTCAWATGFYAMVARPGYQTKILKSYTDEITHKKIGHAPNGALKWALKIGYAYGICVRPYPK